MDLLRMFARPRVPAAKFPDGRVGYAVGDVHGCADLLNTMLAEIEKRAMDDARPAGPPLMVMLGDYVDRGPDSASVIELLLSGRPSNCERRYLRGNHEQAMVAFMEDPVSNRNWLLHGGAETMLSYGAQPPPLIGGSSEEWIAGGEALKAAVPVAHKAFLDGLERYVELGGYVFVHAGVDAERPLAEQPDDVLYWTRARFLGDKRRFSHKVVHGHTPAERPYLDGRRIGLDTGAYASGTLTAARFEGENVTFFEVSSDPRRRSTPEGAFRF